MIPAGRRAVRFDVTWHDDGRKPQHPPDPRYPDGIDIDLSEGAIVHCKGALKRPTPGCGKYVIHCKVCKQTVVVTTAGRADDPRSITLKCRVNPGEGQEPALSNLIEEPRHHTIGRRQ